MKKWAVLAVIGMSLWTVSCRKNVYDRFDPNQDFERFINAHVFAACEFVGKPNARYSLAKIVKRPGDYTPYPDYYKIKFINGPCKGVTVWTTDVILKTTPMEDPTLVPTGTVVLRNFDNPKEQDINVTDHWNLAVVMGTERAQKGILDLGFPRDSNDFFPARESVYAHNVRYVVKPVKKDIRHFIR